MKRRRLILILPLLVIVALIAWPLVTHHKAKRKVEAYKQELLARGEKLTVEELIPPPPTETNRAKEFLAASEQLYEPFYGDYGDFPHCMKFLAPCRARSAWSQDPLVTEGHTNLWPVLEEALTARGEVLEELRTNLSSGVLSFEIDYTRGILTHLNQVKSPVRFFTAGSALALHRDNPDEAVENLSAAIAAQHRWDYEPVGISRLVRIAMGTICFSATWDVLQYEGWNEEQLTRLQAEWQQSSYTGGLKTILEMERTTVIKSFETARISHSDLERALIGDPAENSDATIEWLKQLREEPMETAKELWQRYPGYMHWKHWGSFRDELHFLQYFQRLLELVETIEPNGSMQGISTTAGLLESNAVSMLSPHSRMLVFSVSKFFEKIAVAQAMRDLVVTAIALKRYHLAHGNYPQKLGDLLPQYLDAVPVDIMDGQPLRYSRNADGTFLLYSIGLDGADDSGDPTPVSGSGRSFWIARGRDWVWPLPATPEQIAAEDARLAELWKRKASGQMSQEEELFFERYGIPFNQPTNSP